jgi:hypothetical protein
MADEAVDLETLLSHWRDEVAIEDELRRLQGEADPHDWVPLAEAEQRGGVSRSTLRAWYRSGQIPSRLMPGPHGMQRLVPLDAVLGRVARSPRNAAPSTLPPAPAREETPVPAPAPSTPTPSPSDVVHLAELAVHEARERAAAAERRAEAAELALREAIERAATAEAELRALRRS